MKRRKAYQSTEEHFDDVSQTVPMQKEVQGLTSAEERNWGNLGRFNITLNSRDLVVIKDGEAIFSGIIKECYVPLLARPSRNLIGLAALLTVHDRQLAMLGDDYSGPVLNYLQVIAYRLRINDLFEEMHEELTNYKNGPERERFRGREHEEASAFLKRVYADDLKRGDLYQHQLRKRDPKLMQALSNEFAGRRDKLRELLPPKKSQTDALLSQAGIDPKSPVRRAAAAALRRIAEPK